MSRQSHNITVDGSVFTHNYMGVSLNQGWSGVSVVDSQIGVDYDGSVAGGYTGINTNNRSTYDPDYCRLLSLPPPEPRTSTTVPFVSMTTAVGSCVYQDSCTCDNAAAPGGTVTSPCIIYNMNGATTDVTSCAVSVFEATTMYVVPMNRTV
jgi:hypothetical protein